MKLTNFLKGAAAVLLVLAVAACSGGALYNPGTYTGVGQGHGGTIKVAVTVNEKEIEKIEVIENGESDFSKPVFEEILNAAIENNTADVDAVSGASETSKGLLDALNDAVSKALKGEANEAVKADKAAVELADETADVVIIGAGGAGLSAAKAAADAGAKVIVLEKMAFVGGNTNYATGGMNAAETAPQKALGIEDSIEVYYEDTMKGGKNMNNPELVKVLTTNATKTIDWLIAMGADLSSVGRAGGASANRIHRPTGGAGVGAHLVSVLNEAAGKVADIRTKSEAVAITSDANGVTGVDVETPEGSYHITSKAVIVAGGGFGASPEKIVEFKPSLEGFGTTNHPGATGDSLDLVEAMNVALIDMEQIQTHPTVVPVKNKMITEGVRGEGAILVNRDAVRFIDELETRDVVSEAELKQKGQTAFLFFDQGVRDDLSAIEKYAKAGLLTQADTIEELAETMGLDAAVMVETVNIYNSYVESGVDADFNRDYMNMKLEKAPFYMVEVGPAVHHTMGGIKIDTETRVYDNNDEIVNGLYAAGEVTGGVHGGNRLGGNAVADITTFGRIAGINAAAYAK